MDDDDDGDDNRSCNNDGDNYSEILLIIDYFQN